MALKTASVLCLIFVCFHTVELDQRTLDKKFSYYIIKARCQAHCNEKYGKQLQTAAADIFDIYRSFVCATNTSVCEQCSLPCQYSGHSNLTECQRLCVKKDRHVCEDSCKVFYRIKKEEDEKEEFTRSEALLHLTGPSVTCMHSEKGGDGSPDVHMVYLRWNVRNARNTSSTLPLTFIVGMRRRENETEDPPWGVLGKTNFSFVPIRRLLPGSQYQFNVTAVLANGTVDVTRRTQWVTILPAVSNQPSPPRNVRISRQYLDGSSLTAVVRWNPGPTGGCFFRLSWMSFDILKLSFDSRDIRLWPEFKYELTNLQFGHTYSLEVQTCNRNYRTTNMATSLTFTTSECLPIANYNYTICVPEPPRNLHYEVGEPYSVNGSSVADVTVSWLPPAHLSENNKITEMFVKWHKAPPLSVTRKSFIHQGIQTLPWNATEYVIRKLHVDSVYWVEVTAKAAGGESENRILIETGAVYPNVLQDSRDSNPTNDVKKTSNVEFYYIAILPAILAIIAVLVFVAYRVKFRRKLLRGDGIRIRMAKQEFNPIYGSVVMAGGCKEDSSSYLLPDEYEIEISHLKFLTILGEGAFGRVMKAKLSSDNATRTVAVKILKEYATPEERRSLLLEIETMKQLGQHQNIVSMLGCCSKGPDLCLIMDYCPLGDLRSYLRKYRQKYIYPSLTDRLTGISYSQVKGRLNSDSGISHASHASMGRVCNEATDSDETRSTFTSRRSESSSSYMIQETEGRDSVITDDYEGGINQGTLLSYARQIAMGMEFLSHKKFVHRDLAARNILVYSPRLLKISDFGLTRDIYETNVYQPTSARRLPYKWMPLESIMDNIFTIKSDVWAFGIVLWEIVTFGGSPYPGIDNQDLFYLLKDGYRMEKPENCSHEIYQIMLNCWHPKPQDRLSFAELTCQLDKLLEATSSYIDLSVMVSEDYYQTSSSEESSCLKSCTDSGHKASADAISDIAAEETPPRNAVEVCTVESDGDMTSTWDKDTCDSGQTDLDTSISSCDHDQPDAGYTRDSNSGVALMRAPSLKYGMLSLLGKMGKRGVESRQRLQRHSVSMSELFSLEDDNHCKHRIGSTHLTLF